MIMASPLLSSFCCEFHCNVAENASCHLQMPRWELLFRDGTMSYNILCILSSVFGVIGAVYQLRLRLHDLFGYSARMPEAINRQSRIIFWLAAADGFASLGILIRSCIWLSFDRSHAFVFGDLLCAIISGWIQYFYICTYLWTVMFAVDTYMNAGDSDKCSLWLYHTLTWGLSFLICAVGLTILYYPGLDSCGNTNIARQLPHYLASYIAIVCAMVINPILLWKSSKLVHKDLRQRGSSLIEQKQIVGEVMGRFFSVILIFYACWLPNVVNGIVLLSLNAEIEYRSLGHSVIIALWQMMALLNPIQGFLNSLVYRNIAIWPNRERMKHQEQHSTSAAVAVDGGTTEGEVNEGRNSGSSSDQEPLWNQERSADSPLLIFR